MVVEAESRGETDLRLRFDVDNVPSLIELSRASTTTNGGGEKRSIESSVLVETATHDQVEIGPLEALLLGETRPESGEEPERLRGSPNALANGHAPLVTSRTTSDTSSVGGHTAQPATGFGLFRFSSPNCRSRSSPLESIPQDGAESTSLTASNGYVGKPSMSQAAPLDARDSTAEPDDTAAPPADAAPARGEASGCSSSSSDEDGQQQQLPPPRRDSNDDGDGEAPPEEIKTEDNGDACQVTESVEDGLERKEQKKDESTEPLPKKKSARKSVRFRDDEAEDSEDSTSTRERPDGASSEESVDAEGPKGPVVTVIEDTAPEDEEDKTSECEEEEKVPRGILKKPADRGKQKNRVTFNELMTVFADGYPEVQVPAFRPWDLTDILCFAYEPPPGYRDWDSFDPPAEYMDLVEASMGVTNFHGEDDESVDDPDGQISSREMMEIYRTEFEYSADAVDEPNDFPVVKVDYSFDTSEILENQEIAAQPEILQDTDKVPDVGEFEKEEELQTGECPQQAELVCVDEEKNEEPEEDESPLDSPVRDDDDSVSMEEPSGRYRSKHGAVTDNEDSGPDCDDLSGEDESKSSSVPSVKDVIKPLELKKSLEDGETVNPAEQALTPTTEKELESGDEYHNAASKMMARTNSQIRKSIEMNALRRSLLKGSELCRRRNPSGGGSGAVVGTTGQRPKSPTATSSLEEKLRWLTSTEDLTNLSNNYEECLESLIANAPAEDAKLCEVPQPPSRVASNATPHPQQQAPRLQPQPHPYQPQPQPPPHYVIQPRPTRWSSELLYTSPAPSVSSTSSSSSSTGSSYDNRPQLPSFRPPPTRPCSFDPNMGALAWEGYLQRDKYGYGGSSLSLMRAPYVCTVERHPNAANYPGNGQGGGTGGRGPRDPNNPTSDELEWFVQRDLERIERIKKRYSLTEEEDPTFGFGRRPSVRGIRPRFGSTSEILQQLQAQMRPPRPFSAAGPPRGPWPPGMPPPHLGPQLLHRPKHAGPEGRNVRYQQPLLHPQQAPHPPQQHQQQQQQQPRQQNYYGPPVHQPNPANRTVVVLPRVSEEGGPLPHIVRVRSKHDHAFLIPNGVLFNPHAHSKVNSSSKDERGAPEGASSSPKVSSDSLYPHQTPAHQSGSGQAAKEGFAATTTATDSDQKEAVIYYSLRV